MYAEQRTCRLYCTVMESLYENQDILSAREKEFCHVKGVTYLDHAGATLYSNLQLQSYLLDLTTNLYGNPHSQNPSSKLTSDIIEQTREKVLNHFNTNLAHYDIVFTSGCTAALKLLAETFPWAGKHTEHTQVLYLPDHIDELTSESQANEKSPSPDSLSSGSVFCYLEDNHTSVVGMREEAARYGSVRIVCATEANLVPNPDHSSSYSKHNNTTSELEEETEPYQLKDLSETRLACVPIPAITSAGMDSSSTNLRPPYHLFVYPAQSNFSGRKYPLSWVNAIPTRQLVCDGLSSLPGSWLVALDAASFVSTSKLDLSSYPAHFVAISFYKMFGFPTGLGALLVRRDCCQLLTKTYYGGGTVAATVSREGFHIPRSELHERFEDGTVSFLSIAALSHGFNTLYRIGRTMEEISQHTFTLAQYVYKSLSDLNHGNGQKVCTLYCQTGFENPSVQGPIVNFNLVRPDGRAVGYSEVDKLACVYDIHLRTGCFCNTGACMSHLGITTDTLKEHLEAGHVCGDSLDVIDGQPTGSVRVSFGYMSTFEDAQTFVKFIKECFVDRASLIEDPVSTTTPSYQSSSLSYKDAGPNSHEEVLSLTTIPVSDDHVILDSIWITVGDRIEASCGDKCLTQTGQLKQLTLYPIKSCSGQSVSRWPLGDKGLLHDREWMVVSESGYMLSQKQEGKLCLVQPVVNLETHTLTLNAKGHHSMSLPLDTHSEWLSDKLPLKTTASSSLTTRVCGDRIQSIDCGDQAADWLTRVIHRQCRLVRQNPKMKRLSKNKPHNERDTPLSLANEAQYLLITHSSVEELCAAVNKGTQSSERKNSLSVEDLILRFRPNIVIGNDHTHPTTIDHIPTLEPYSEEQWQSVRIGNTDFAVSGLCSRCQMICVDQSSGERSPEPLKTLMEQRGSKVPFGIYLSKSTLPS